MSNRKSESIGAVMAEGSQLQLSPWFYSVPFYTMDAVIPTMATSTPFALGDAPPAVFCILGPLFTPF